MIGISADVEQIDSKKEGADKGDAGPSKRMSKHDGDRAEEEKVVKENKIPEFEPGDFSRLKGDDHPKEYAILRKKRMSGCLACLYRFAKMADVSLPHSFMG